MCGRYDCHGKAGKKKKMVIKGSPVLLQLMLTGGLLFEKEKD